MDSKLNRVVTIDERNPITKSHDTSIVCHMTDCTVDILIRVVPRMIRPHPTCHVPHRLRDYIDYGHVTATQ